jgi:hypothetical protein
MVIRKMAEGVGLPPAKRGALRDFLDELLRATSAFKPNTSRLGSHPTPELNGGDGLRDGRP